MYAITFTGTINGRRHTGTFELDLDRMTKSAIATDILEGQFDGINEIFEFDPEEGTCRNVTEDMAKLVAALAAQEYRSIGWHVRSWLHEKGGLSLHSWEAA